MATNKVSDGKQFNIAVPSGVTSGDPTLVGSLLPCVALTDRDSSGNATIDCDGIYDLSVKGVDDNGNSAVAVGDRLYWTTGDTPKINKKISGALFGFALEAVGSGSTATINVKLAGLAGAGENALAAHISDPAAMAAITASTPAAQTSAALTDNGGGAAADGTIADIASADASETTDRSVIADAVKELSDQINKCVADITAVRTQTAALVVDVTAAKTAVDANNAAIDSILAALDNRVTASS